MLFSRHAFKTFVQDLLPFNIIFQKNILPQPSLNWAVFNTSITFQLVNIDPCFMAYDIII